MRICGDYKVTVNQEIVVDQYPLPRIEDIFANLSGGKHFTKIDLRNAYLQLEVDDASKNLLTINTHKGLFRYNRMCFGVASAAAIWQRTIEQVLQGLPGVQCILDDMIVTGSTDAEHLQNLENVVKRLDENGLKANLEKCEFFKKRVEYCGHEITSDGLHRKHDKVEAIKNSPRPENVTQVRAYLGLLNYYHRFLPNIATVAKPLYELLEKDNKWNWSSKCESAFKKTKELVTSDLVLCHHDPALPIRLACDASQVGVGAVISHVLKDGTEKPIAFASRALSKTEQRYSQIDKEALAIIFGVKKFHSYLFGRHFTLITDHQPLVSIFNPKKGISATSAARLQRYAVYLTGYTYDIEYKNTKKHGNADALSRLPHGKPEENAEDKAVELFQLTQLESVPITDAEIKRETQKEKILSQVYRCTMEGWIMKPEEKCLQPFYARRDELTIEQGCLLWGIRVIVPVKYRRDVLEMIHSGHNGVVRMKSIARSYVWWPGIDADIEQTAKSCAGCQANSNNPPTATTHPWQWPSTPFELVHVDFAGPFMNTKFFVLVDAHSKWPEVFTMKTTSATKTIEILRAIFARNGLPRQLVSDNGPQFISDEFKQFMDSNGIKHFKSAPYHPATNGLAERFIQTMKHSLRAMPKSSLPLSVKLANFMLAYRNTPHATTNETPAKLFLGRNLRTCLDLIRPDVQNRVNNQQSKQTFESNTQTRNFEIGQDIMVRNYREGDKWVRVTVREKLGPLLYEVETRDGGRWKRHVDQCRDNVNTPKHAETTDESAERASVCDTADNQNNDAPVNRRYPIRNRTEPKRLIEEC